MKTPNKKNTERQKEQARQIARCQLLDWYLANNHEEPPERQCIDAKVYKGLSLWWLEPPPKLASDDYVIIEEEFGGSWSIRTVKREKQIRVFIP